MTGRDAAARAGVHPATRFGSVLAVFEPESDAGPAIALAANIARGSGARLTIAAIASPLPEAELARFARSSGRAVEAIQADLAAAARNAVMAAVAEGCPDITPEVMVVFGKPFVEIIRTVVAGGHDLVVKRAEELGGSLSHLLASTDQHLLRKCPATVLLHRGKRDTLSGPVAAAVDVEGDSASEPETETALNDRIVDVGIALAGIAGGLLHLVSAWDVPGEGLVRIYGDAGEADIDRYILEVEAQHARDLNALVAAGRERVAVASHQGIAIAPHLVRGMPRAAIPEAVATIGAGVLVMGTVARTGLRGFIIGNTAEDVVNTVDTTIVAVKPPGYVSPLTG